jgi:hypothetical protein
VSVWRGTRTFLSAALCFAGQGNKSGPYSCAGQAADKNVRAPLNTCRQTEGTRSGKPTTSVRIAYHKQGGYRG